MKSLWASLTRRWRATGEPARIVALGVVLGLLALLPTSLRFAAIPAAILVPGYAVLAAAIGPRRPSALVVRLGAQIAVGSASLVLATLLVSFPSAIVTRPRVLVAQLLVVLASAAVVARRSDRVVADSDDLQRQRGDAWRWLAVVAVAAAVATVGVFGVNALDNTRPTPYVSFSFRGTSPATTLPHPGSKNAVIRVTVVNAGPTSRTFTIKSGVDRGRLWRTRTVTVRAGTTWNGAVAGRVPSSGCLQRIAVALLDGDRPAVGRLTRWVGGAPGRVCLREKVTTRATTP